MCIVGCKARTLVDQLVTGDHRLVGVHAVHVLVLVLQDQTRDQVRLLPDPCLGIG